MSVPPYVVGPVLKVGDRAPSSFPEEDRIPFPSDKPVVVVFLRYCGCPFAEKTLRHLAALSTKYHPLINFIAVTQSNQADTNKWVVSSGGAWEISKIIPDEQRKLYRQWGLGEESTLWHTYNLINPWTLYSQYRLGIEEGVNGFWFKQDEGTVIRSGQNVYQMGGAFGLDREGCVVWVHLEKDAGDVPDLRGCVRRLLEGGSWRSSSAGGGESDRNRRERRASTGGGTMMMTRNPLGSTGNGTGAGNGTAAEQHGIGIERLD